MRKKNERVRMNGNERHEGKNERKWENLKMKKKKMCV